VRLARAMVRDTRVWIESCLKFNELLYNSFIPAFLVYGQMFLKDQKHRFRKKTLRRKLLLCGLLERSVGLATAVRFRDFQAPKPILLSAETIQTSKDMIEDSQLRYPVINRLPFPIHRFTLVHQSNLLGSQLSLQLRNLLLQLRVALEQHLVVRLVVVVLSSSSSSMATRPCPLP